MKIKGVSETARILHSALIQRSINASVEKWDNHKHIDIAIEDAKLYIEIDGDEHYIDSDTIIRDLTRDHFSTEDGYDTIHIPNAIVKSKLNEVAEAISKVAIHRMNS